MDGQWYCSVGGQETGPLTPQQLRAMAESGGLMPTDRVRQGTTGNWVRASQVKGLFAVSPLATPPGPEMRTGSAPFEGSADLASLNPAAHRGSEGSALPAYSRRRRQQQQRLIGSLAVVGAGVIIALLILIFGHIGGSGPDRTGPATSKPVNESRKAFAAPETSQPDKLLAPAPAEESPRESAEKGAAAPAKKNPAGKKAKTVDMPPLRPPTGKPEEDFGIRPDEAPSQAPPPPSAKKPS